LISYSRAGRWTESETLESVPLGGDRGDGWVLVVMITTAEDRQYVPSVEFTGQMPALVSAKRTR
jgi:hypothetical protein